MNYPVISSAFQDGSMYIFPIEKPAGRTRPPLATIGLILINCLIFLFTPAGGPAFAAFAMKFGFVPAEHAPVTLFTHTFLHAGLGHLTGNMVFLFLAGVAVEAMLGSSLYLLFYLASGQFAAGLFWLFNVGSTAPVVGASGCIAGLMGLSAALFGFRNIRFLQGLPLRFAFVSAPMSILLPVWALTELYQYRSVVESPVAYLAHVGALLAGGTIGLGIKRLGRQGDTDPMSASDWKENRNRLYQRGMKHLKALEIDEAYASFQTLLEHDPEDVEALLQLYKVARFTPRSPRYRSVAERVLSAPPGSKLTVGNLHEVYNDWRRLGLEPLTAELAVSLARRLCAAGHVDTAEAIAQELLEGGRNDEQTAELLFALASQAARGGHFGKQQLYLNLMLEHFPHQEATRSARQLLGG
jgi:membrane associated rhomboid family serine protease